MLHMTHFEMRRQCIPSTDFVEWPIMTDFNYLNIYHTKNIFITRKKVHHNKILNVQGGKKQREDEKNEYI